MRVRWGEKNRCSKHERSEATRYTIDVPCDTRYSGKAAYPTSVVVRRFQGRSARVVTCPERTVTVIEVSPLIKLGDQRSTARETRLLAVDPATMLKKIGIESLPEHWSTRKDQSGTKYYWNSVNTL